MRSRRETAIPSPRQGAGGAGVVVLVGVGMVVMEEAGVVVAAAVVILAYVAEVCEES